MNFQQDQKGLFTFYRQQEALESEIKRKKKQIKLKKQRQKQENEKQKQEAAQRQRLIKQQKELQLQKLRQKLKTERKQLFEPKHKQQKYEKKKFGSSVIIINQVKNNKRAKSNLGDPLRQKSFSKDNQEKSKGYFLQNKQLPFSFGQVSLQKIMVDERNEEKMKFMPVPVNYYNRYAEEEEKKYVPSYSYQKLPQVSKKKRSSESVFPKLQKSKRIEIALKSGNSEIIKKIRESMKQQMVQRQEQVSYINYTGNSYEEKPNLKLNEQQRKIIQIIRSKKHFQ